MKNDLIRSLDCFLIKKYCKWQEKCQSIGSNILGRNILLKTYFTISPF